MSDRLSLGDVQRVYALLKQKAKDLYSAHRLEESWMIMTQAVSVIQEFNWEYADDDLEKLLCKISVAWIPDTPADYSSVGNRVVILDDWCTSYVLVLQYIEALVAAKKEILYITSRNPNSISRGSVFNRVKQYPNTKAIAFWAESQDKKSWCQDVYKSILDFKPEKVVAHIGSCSSFLCVLSRLPKGIVSYRSNLDDQCFWLGKSVIDYCLEFRPFGVSVSRERRAIPKEKQLYVPFYPINDGNSFGGFPDLPAGTVKLFSGGDFYKTIDPDFTYWNLVKLILQNNPKAVLLYATKNVLGKTKSFLEDFVRENHLENQFFYIGFRPDIYEVFAHCDIFLGTCPICGSLTSQLACVNRKPILQFYLPGTDDDETEQAVCYNAPGLQISFTDKDAFLAEAKHLIDDESYRLSKGEEMFLAMETKEQFNTGFIKAIYSNYAPCPTKEVNYDEVLRRWWWPEQTGFDDHLSYLPSLLKRFGLLHRFPALWFKYNWRRFFTQKLLSPSWYKMKMKNG